MPRPVLRLLLALLALGSCIPLLAGEVTVAVASNFSAPMHKIAAAFEKDTGHKTVLVIGSTGKFHAQISNGAPFQMLLAADSETPARLEKAGLAVAGTRFTYATGQLMLWSAQLGLVDAQGTVLAKGAFERIALADPKVAPYGLAALQTLTVLGLVEQLRPRFVQGESIAQAYQFVATGNAALGFVALSQVMVDGRMAAGSAWVVPAALHAPIRQDAVILSQGKGLPAATALASYLRGEKARAVMRSYGYVF